MMALFKNLYLDLSYLNPFKKHKSEKKETKQFPVAFKLEHFQKQEPFQKQDHSNKIRELPPISSRLLGVEKPHEKEVHEKKHDETKLISKLPPKELKSPRLPASLTNNFQKVEKEPVVNVASDIRSNVVSETQNYVNSQSSNFNNIPEDNPTFFSSLYSRMSREENYLHNSAYSRVLDNNLFEEMQNFWHNKKEELGRTAFNKAVKTDLMKKMSELQGLEIEWQKLQLQEERLKDELASKEMVIENNARQLKRSFKKLHLNMEIKPEHYFVLADGKKLKNLQELYENVKYLDNTTFSHHVNESRNDFSTWVKDIMGLSELSLMMKEAKTKEELYHSIDKWYSSG
jgi:hypothetical protein